MLQAYKALAVSNDSYSRLMALDYGSKRIGVALTDPMQMFASPHGYIENNNRIFKAIIALIDEKQVCKIIVGLPNTLKGEQALAAQDVQAFVEKLREQISVDVELWDERLTTAQTEKMLIAADVKRNKRKHLRDQIAATLILQNYLDSLTVA